VRAAPPPLTLTRSLTHAYLRGLFKRTSTFLFSAGLASLAAILVCAGAALWTAAIAAAQSVNALALQPAQAGAPVPLGIIVGAGKGLTLLWAAFGCMTAALIPYWIRSAVFARARTHTG
jgi:hypothetical protein